MLTSFFREMNSKQIFVVFLIIDNPKKDSILDIKYYDRTPEGKFTLSPYIDKFPFPYYIILREIDKLPEILADALRQWFEMIQRAS